VNLGSSIYLASRYGAIGVALGTLIGSFVSVGLHFAITMHFTRRTLAIARAGLLLEGLLHPAIVLVPTLLMYLLGRGNQWLILEPAVVFAWGLSTLILAWFGVLGNSERSDVVQLIGRFRMLLARS
jgi:hypothetical protein